MKDKSKEKLLKRKFQSTEYTKEFIFLYKNFIDYGLTTLERYLEYKNKNSNFTPDDSMIADEKLWITKVRPNFLRMASIADDIQKKTTTENIAEIAMLAKNFKGLNRDMDGIRESFMDVLEPSVKKTYMDLWNKAHKSASNIYYTYKKSWKDEEILNENITGPIDEKELLNHLKPYETLDD